MPQICIHPKGVAQLTGIKYGTAKVPLQRIRAELSKPVRTFVSVAEFPHYTHLPDKKVSRALGQDQRSQPDLKHNWSMTQVNLIPLCL